MNETILIVLGAIGFLAAGAGLGFWLAQLRLRDQSARADAVQQQFDDYRREVTQHFGRTAEHFKAIGREYRELYEHMASGADALCDREAAGVKLSFAPKAILESIADDLQEPEPPRDFATDKPAPADALEAKDETIAADEKKEPGQAPGADPEAEAEDNAGRTLH